LRSLVVKLLLLILGMNCLGAIASENLASPIFNPEQIVSTPDFSDTLFGDWGGKRGPISVQGYDWEIVYKLDLLSKVSAPDCSGSTEAPCNVIYGLDNLDIKLSLNGEKLFGIKGGSGLLYILSNRGSKPALSSDRLPHGLDNIETPYNANTTKLYQAWIQQTFLDERLSVLVGLYDLNSEFYVTESSGIFIHPTFGVGAELASTSLNGPSIFPNTSLAVRVKAELAPGYFVQAGILDGVSGDPNNPHGTHVQFNQGDGTLNVIEGSIPLSTAENAHDNKLSLGVWQYTARFDDWVEKDINGNPVKSRSYGYYALLDKVLRHKPGGNEESINGFVRIGKTNADASPSQFDMAFSTGLVFSGLFAGRDQDQFGFAFAQERNGAKYLAASGSTVPNEKSLELTYRYRTVPGLVLQPEVQYLLNHGNDPAQNKSWWLGMRFEVSI